MPRMILSLASASALHSRSVGWRGYDSSSVAAMQIPRTRCLPTAVPCAPASCRRLVWEWGLNGLAANTELLVSELVTNAVKTTAGNNGQAAICLQLSGDNTRVLIEVWMPTRSRQCSKISAKMAPPTLTKREGAGCA